MPASWVETREVPLGDLTRFPGNARRGNVEEIRKSLRRHGQYRAIVVRETGDGLVILAGNHTYDAVGAEGHDVIRCEIVTCTDDEARRINLADNRLSDMAVDDSDALAELLSYLEGDYDGTGWTEEDVEALIDPPGGDGLGDDGDSTDNPSLADKFLLPPFDVLDARQGWWRVRKAQWMGLGLVSEVGRGDHLVFDGHARADPQYYDKKSAVEKKLGKELTTAEFEAEHYIAPDKGVGGGTSIFDPVLCELAYRWFSPAGGTILDPFAGGSVRGLVAAMLGRDYIGNDLSELQVKENNEQGEEFTQRGLITSRPLWSCGDSAQWAPALEPASADMIFTCPPYYNLESYSDDPADLSAMSFDGFDEVYEKIIAGAARALRTNRYAVFVVGDVRDKKGRLHDLRGATVRACETAGLTYVNGAVLITPLGSLPVTVSRAFVATRTLGRSHQDVMVFCKGNRSQAAKACGEIEVHIPEDVAEAWGADQEA